MLRYVFNITEESHQDRHIMDLLVLVPLAINWMTHAKSFFESDEWLFLKMLYYRREYGPLGLRLRR